MATSKDTPTTAGTEVRLVVNAKDPDLFDVVPIEVKKT